MVNEDVYGTACQQSKSNQLEEAALDILFSSNHNIHKSSCSLCFWASDPLIDRFYKKNNQLKCLKPKYKGHMNFYECCDLTKKYI